jgi:hypothetical protein
MWDSPGVQALKTLVILTLSGVIIWMLSRSNASENKVPIILHSIQLFILITSGCFMAPFIEMWKCLLVKGEKEKEKEKS